MSNILIALAATVSILGVSGYSSSGSDNPFGVSTSQARRLDFRLPTKGETKAEVKAQYSDPDQVSQDAEHGESWVYVFGKDRLNNRLLIPGSALFVRVRVLRINFDREGRVTSWRTALVTTTPLSAARVGNTFSAYCAKTLAAAAMPFRPESRDCSLALASLGQGNLHVVFG
jgi:hypothetical protein